MIVKENNIAKIKEHSKNKRIVVVCGVYDILHVGHIRFLRSAKALGDILVVGLPADRFVKEMKGDKRPVNSVEERAEVIDSLEMVDIVVMGNEEPYISLFLVKSIAPDVFAHTGILRDGLLDRLSMASPLMELVDIPEIEKSRFSTTAILERGGN